MMRSLRRSGRFKADRSVLLLHRLLKVVLQKWVKAVAQAVHQGIISGYSDGTFRPDKNIAYAEMIVSVMKAPGLPIDEKEKTNYADIPAWVKVLSTRAEDSSVIVRMLSVKK